MESISFRAWDKEEKKMHKVKTIEFSRRGARIIHLAEVQSNGKGDHKRWHSSVKLMQSTGLKDNDGIEFYKKDIVRNIDSEELGVVEYDEGQFRVSYNGVSEQLWEIDKDLQIIGNIYENPELLEDN